MSKAKRREQQRRRAGFVLSIGQFERLRPVRRFDVYVDPIAVEKAAAGHIVRVTSSERRAAVQLLTQRKLSARQIAERMRISSRTVQRCRAHALVRVSAFGE